MFKLPEKGGEVKDNIVSSKGNLRTNQFMESTKVNLWKKSDEKNLMTAPGMEQENPRPDQAVVGVLVSPAG